MYPNTITREDIAQIYDQLAVKARERASLSGDEYQLRADLSLAIMRTQQAKTLREIDRLGRSIGDRVA